MKTVSLSRAQAVAAGASIAVLRGLYGDLGESLHDAETCRWLWSQVEEEHASAPRHDRGTPRRRAVAGSRRRAQEPVTVPFWSQITAVRRHENVRVHMISRVQPSMKSPCAVRPGVTSVPLIV